MAPTRSTILENLKNGRQPEEYNLTIKSQENRVDFENCKDDEGKLRICTNIVQETNVVVEKIQEKREEDSKVLEYGEPEDTTIQGPVFRGEYFPLCCDNHHGIVSKFDQISEMFLFQKSKKSVEKTFLKFKNPLFALTHINL